MFAFHSSPLRLELAYVASAFDLAGDADERDVGCREGAGGY